MCHTVPHGHACPEARCAPWQTSPPLHTSMTRGRERKEKNPHFVFCAAVPQGMGQEVSQITIGKRVVRRSHSVSFPIVALRLALHEFWHAFVSPSPLSLQVVMKDKLGEGGYSFVYLVEDSSTGEQFALKRCIAADANAAALAEKVGIFGSGLSDDASQPQRI